MKASLHLIQVSGSTFLNVSSRLQPPHRCRVTRAAPADLTRLLQGCMDLPADCWHQLLSASQSSAILLSNQQHHNTNTVVRLKKNIKSKIKFWRRVGLCAPQAHVSLIHSCICVAPFTSVVPCSSQSHFRHRNQQQQRGLGQYMKKQLVLVPVF